MPLWEYKRGKQPPFLREGQDCIRTYHLAHLLSYTELLIAWACLEGFYPAME